MLAAEKQNETLSVNLKSWPQNPAGSHGLECSKKHLIFMCWGRLYKETTQPTSTLEMTSTAAGRGTWEGKSRDSQWASTTSPYSILSAEQRLPTSHHPLVPPILFCLLALSTQPGYLAWELSTRISPEEKHEMSEFISMYYKPWNQVLTISVSADLMWMDSFERTCHSNRAPILFNGHFAQVKTAN